MDKDLQLAMAAYQSMYEQPDETEEIEEEEIEELQEGPLQDLGTTIKYVAGGGAAGAEQRRNQDLATAKRLGDIRAGRTPAGGMRASAYGGDLGAMRSALKNSYEPEGEEIDEGMSMSDFKKRRRSLAGKEASAEARKRGHEGKEWHNTGRTYSPDEAKSRRANLTDKERSERHGVAADPDSPEGYGASKTKNPKKLRKQKAMGELGEGFDIFDTILEYLISEGYADTNESALVIMANMSEEWRQEIVESIVSSSTRSGNTGMPNLGSVVNAGKQVLDTVLKNRNPGRTTPPGGYSTRSGDNKPYADGPLWDSNQKPEDVKDTPTRTKPPVRKPTPPMRDEPLW